MYTKIYTYIPKLKRLFYVLPMCVCACVYVYMYMYAPTLLILSPTIEQLLGTAHQTLTTDVPEISHTRSVAAGNSADIMMGTGQ